MSTTHADSLLRGSAFAFQVWAAVGFRYRPVSFRVETAMMNVGRSRPRFPRFDHLTSRLFDQSTRRLPTAGCKLPAVPRLSALAPWWAASCPLQAASCFLAVGSRLSFRIPNFAFRLGQPAARCQLFPGRGWARGGPGVKPLKPIAAKLI
jgi:hypothetical protein